MSDCEHCSAEHDKSYGSGRFCGVRCARAFSTASRRKEISERVKETLRHRFNSEDRERAQVTRRTQRENRLKSWDTMPQRHRREQVMADQDGKCLHCNLNSWLGKALKLELDHIDGQNKNNSRDNLRFLCPNCHSQTDTFRNLNRPAGKRVDDQVLLQALKDCSSIRQALLQVGLVAKGGNYSRAKKLLQQLDD